MGGQPRNRSAVAGASLMELKWTSKALSDLVRLYEFLAPVNRQAAVRVVRSLTTAPNRLLRYP